MYNFNTAIYNKSMRDRMLLFYSWNKNNIKAAGGACNRNISLISRGLIRRDARRLEAGPQRETFVPLAIAYRASSGDARIHIPTEFSASSPSRRMCRASVTV